MRVVLSVQYTDSLSFGFQPKASLNVWGKNTLPFFTFDIIMFCGDACWLAFGFWFVSFCIMTILPMGKRVTASSGSSRRCFLN